MRGGRLARVFEACVLRTHFDFPSAALHFQKLNCKASGAAAVPKVELHIPMCDLLCLLRGLPYLLAVLLCLPHGMLILRHGCTAVCRAAPGLWAARLSRQSRLHCAASGRFSRGNRPFSHGSRRFCLPCGMPGLPRVPFYRLRPPSHLPPALHTLRVALHAFVRRMLPGFSAARRYQRLNCMPHARVHVRLRGCIAISWAAFSKVELHCRMRGLHGLPTASHGRPRNLRRRARGRFCLAPRPLRLLRLALCFPARLLASLSCSYSLPCELHSLPGALHGRMAESHAHPAGMHGLLAGMHGLPPPLHGRLRRLHCLPAELHCLSGGLHCLPGELHCLLRVLLCLPAAPLLLQGRSGIGALARMARPPCGVLAPSRGDRSSLGLLCIFRFFASS